MEERRQHRSSDPIEALLHQLDTVRTRAKLRAVVVADKSGLLLAGSGDPEACEELAAYAPLPQMKNPNHLRTIHTCAGELFLCVEGVSSDVPLDAASLARAAEGVERILSLAA